ncbi:Na+/H+ antiporter subunit E [Marinicrinis lubricantis]|uniref:Na+/H+ antiporter subunit E n=1 Tax=Marinicrinis lubricantis TaxID=2086470 RepID=A0ABW1IK02_9BACL
MAFQILINMIIAFVWMFLNNSWNPVHFMMGYALGLGFLFLLRRFISYNFYMRKVWAIFKLIVLFLKELLLSNFDVLAHVLRPKLKISPGVFALKTELKSDWEITALACLITLTPGTLTMEVSPNNQVLYIHALNIDDADELAAQIKGSFEKAIMEVSRNV